MISEIIIKNVSIAHHVALSLEPGFNIITGETGSGKSLILTALSLLLGQRCEKHFFSKDAPFLEVAAYVKGSKELIQSFFKQHNIPYDKEALKEVIVKRTVFKEGKSRTSINDSLVSLKTLSQFLSLFVELGSQHETQSLFKSEYHTILLDKFAHSFTTNKTYQKAYKEFKKDLETLDALLKKQDFEIREKELLEFEVGQIEKAQLSLEEFEKLESTIQIYKKQSLVLSLCGEVKELIEGDAQTLHLFSLLQKKLHRLLGLFNEALYEEKRNQTLSHYEHLKLYLDELSHNVEYFENLCHVHEQTYLEAFERIEVYNHLLQKWGPTLDEVLRYYKSIQERLRTYSSLEEDIQNLKEGLTSKAQLLLELSSVLTEKREASACELSKKVKEEFLELGMKNAEFFCALEKEPVGFKEHEEALSFLEPSILERLSLLSKYGQEKIQFYFKSHKESEFLNVQKIASGGEMSRVLLAIKLILDTGLSGSVASKIGKRLLHFCKTNQKAQILSVTHLPQVASYATHHFIVVKKFEPHTHVVVTKATAEEQILELSAMLSNHASKGLEKEAIVNAKKLKENALSSAIDAHEAF
jgi:DNA repair protein RecN (Recombination protein N)